MGKPLRVLMIEDSPDDALLLVRELRRGGYEPVYERVETAEDLRRALENGAWDLVLSDYTMPRFRVTEALELFKEQGLDAPFVVVSGSVGEEIAVETMRAGANDYVMKDKLTRLSSAVTRELREAEARQRYREAERRYRFLVEQIPAVTYVQNPVESDHPKAVTYMSPQYETMFGYSPEKEILDEEHWLKTLHPEDRDRVLAEEERTDATGEPFEMEYRVIASDGGVVWVRDHAVLVRDEAGRPLYWQGVQFDITDQKRTEEALRESEERFRATFEQAAVGMAHVDLDGRWLHVNEKLLEIVGYGREELLGLTFQDITHPDDLDADLDHLRRLLAGEMETYSMEKRYFRKDGSIVWIELTVSLVRNASGKPAYFISVIEDITGRKRGEGEQRLLAEAGEVLASSLDYKTTLSAVARLAVPSLADWCAVDVIEDDGSIGRLAVVHEDPKKVTLAHQLQERYPPNPDAASGVPQVLRSGRSEFYPEVTDEMIEAAARDEEQRKLVRELGFTSVIIAPLVARGRTLGAITLVSAESGWKYGAGDLALAEELARRAALAVDNARLYQEAIAEIAERRRAEEELRRSRDQLDIILRGVADGVIAQDAYGHIFYSNDTAARMSGYQSAEAFVEAPVQETMSKFEVLDPEGHPFPLERLPGRRALRGEEATEVIRFRILATGEERWSVVSATPVFDEEGRTRMVVTILRDITEQRRAEQERARLASIVESSEDAIISKTLDGTITSWNRGAQKIYGYSAQEIVGQSITTIVPPGRPDEIPKILEKLRRGEKIEHYDTVRVTKDGRLLNISLTVSPIRDSEGTVVGASTIARDVTERRLTEQRVREAREAERSRIAQDMHDDALQSLVYALYEVQILQVSGAGRQADALEDISDALRLSVEGLRSAIFELRLERTLGLSFVASLNALVELTRRMSRRRFEVSLEIDEQFPHELSRPAGGELIRILQEALNNARRHSSPRNVSVRLWREGDTALVEIDDDGRGFDAGSSGGGVGLSAMRQRASSLGGALRIDSEPGSGTRVRFEAPVAGLLDQ